MSRRPIHGVRCGEVHELPPDSPHPSVAPTEEERYPCDRCGKLRTKAEGGTTFTVCDSCWDETFPKSPTPSGDLEAAEQHVSILRSQLAATEQRIRELEGNIENGDAALRKARLEAIEQLARADAAEQRIRDLEGELQLDREWRELAARRIEAAEREVAEGKRETDRLWCTALIAAGLDTYAIEKVTTEALRLRAAPVDGPIEGEDNCGRYVMALERYCWLLANDALPQVAEIRASILAHGVKATFRSDPDYAPSPEDNLLPACPACRGSGIDQSLASTIEGEDSHAK